MLFSYSVEFDRAGTYLQKTIRKPLRSISVVISNRNDSISLRGFAMINVGNYREISTEEHLMNMV